jgi:hypothetical protein
MALDLPTILKDLQSLPPDQNPFNHIAAIIDDSRDQGWNTAMTVTVCVCAAASWCSVVANGTVLVRRFRSGDSSLVRVVPSRLGAFWVPQLSVAWSAAEVVTFVFIQLDCGITLYEGFLGRAKLPFSFAFRNFIFLGAVILGFLHLVNTVRNCASANRL